MRALIEATVSRVKRGAGDKESTSTATGALPSSATRR